MRVPRGVASVLLLALLWSQGCATTRNIGPLIATGQIRLGQSYAEVRAVAGPPARVETRTMDGVPLTIWHYRHLDDFDQFMYGVGVLGSLGLVAIMYPDGPPEHLQKRNYIVFADGGVVSWDRMPQVTALRPSQDRARPPEPEQKRPIRPAPTAPAAPQPQTPRGPEPAAHPAPPASPAGSGSSKGLYELERALNFNVLDYVVVDPGTGAVTLVGHRDPRFGGPQIPYLQHLASLLEHPQPEFSLTWTRESEASIDALFRRLDSDQEMRRIAREWGRWFDDEGRVTPQGRWALPVFGVTPPSERSLDSLTGQEMTAMILRAAGNTRGADVMEKYGLLALVSRSTDPAAREVAQAVLYDLVVSAGTLAEWQQIEADLRSGRLSQGQTSIQLWHVLFPAIERSVGFPSGSVHGPYSQALARGASFPRALDAGFAQIKGRIDTVLEGAMHAILSRRDEVQVPPEVIQTTLGVRPEVVPDYRGIDPRSQLARVLFESDYLGKSLINKPELKQRIPRYQTEFEFARSNPSRTRVSGTTSTHHLWISIGSLNVARSADGFTLATRAAGMRFNLRERRGNGTTLAPAPGDYAELLTSLYDEVAAVHPILHELRETAKLAAAAHWLRARRPDFALPRTGRVLWHGPARVPGLVYVTWSPKPASPGAPVMAAKAMGGVSLVIPLPAARSPGTPVGDDFPVDSSVVDLRPSLPPRTPRAYGREALEAVLQRVPVPPVPQAVGWVTEEIGGQTPLQAVSVAPTTWQGGAAAVVLSRSAGSRALLWNALDLQAARDSLLAALRQPSTDPRQRAVLHMLLGQVLHEMGDDRAAVRELQEGVKLAPDLPLVHVLHARALLEQGQVREAEAALRQYLALEPASPAVTNVLRSLQAFPPGGPSLPAGGPIPSGPMGQTLRVALKNAREQLDVVEQHAVAGVQQQSEASKIESGAGWDTAPTRPPGPSGAAIRVPPVPREIPAALARSPQWVALQQRERELVQSSEQLQKELERVRAKKKLGEGDKGQLDMAEAYLGHRLSEVTGEIGEVRTKMLDLSIQFEPGAQQGQREPAIVP